MDSHYLYKQVLKSVKNCLYHGHQVHKGFLYPQIEGRYEEENNTHNVVIEEKQKDFGVVVTVTNKETLISEKYEYGADNYENARKELAFLVLL